MKPLQHVLQPVNQPVLRTSMRNMTGNDDAVQHTIDLSRLSDGAVLERFVQGDARAFAELYRRRHLEIYRFILNFLHGDEDMAADIFQETFIKVHDNAHTLRESGTVRSWMYTIARNTCLNILKRQGRQVRLDEQHENMEDSDALLPDEIYERDTLHAALDEAITQLPDNQREAVLLREFEGFSYAEIAQATDTNVGVVRQRLWRAKQSLRTMLADLFTDA
ncbi:MAG: sigma-70 family RNA polymerase sigma factor [Bacteroidota bacterium]|nr:sigma-70 family RNA polymerase sigma factor [Bacteroidota bacterium]